MVTAAAGFIEAAAIAGEFDARGDRAIGARGVRTAEFDQANVFALGVFKATPPRVEGALALLAKGEQFPKEVLRDVLGNLGNTKAKAVEIVEQFPAVTHRFAGFKNSKQINRAGQPVNDYPDPFSFTDLPVRRGRSRSRKRGHAAFPKKTGQRRMQEAHRARSWA